MNRPIGPLPRTIAAVAVAGALVWAPAASAQTATTAGAKPPAATATPARPATAPAAASPTGKAGACPAGTRCAQGTTAPAGQATRARVPPPTTAEQLAALPPAEEAQRAASDLVHYGKYVCDDRFEVFIERNQIAQGYVDVRYKRDIWVMKPVASNTGAVRLEDTKGRVLLVQIPFKSMLLNTQTGQRIVDSCQHEVQKDAEAQARNETQGGTSKP